MSEKKPFDVERFFEEKMNKNLRENPEVMDGFDCVYQFDIEDDIWSLDLTVEEDRQIKRGKHKSPDCTIIISNENFGKLMRRQLNVPFALISGKIKIKGEKGLALKLTELFG